MLASEGYIWDQKTSRLSAIKRPSRASYNVALESAAALVEAQTFADELLEDRNAERIGVERSRLNRFIRQVCHFFKVWLERIRLLRHFVLLCFGSAAWVLC